MESQRQAFSGRARAHAPLSGLTGTVRVEGRGGVRGRRGSGFTRGRTQEPRGRKQGWPRAEAVRTVVTPGGWCAWAQRGSSGPSSVSGSWARARMFSGCRREFRGQGLTAFPL